MTLAPGELPSKRVRRRGFDIDGDPAEFEDWWREVAACQKAAALFDFSSLVTLSVEGPGAAKVLERWAARSLENMSVGAIRYGLTTAPDGSLRADLTLWRTGEDRFLVMTGRAADFDPLHAAVKLSQSEITLTDLTDRTYVLALQGPQTEDLLNGSRLPPRFRFAETSLFGEACHIGSIGYTGRAGVEILCDATAAERLWQRLASVATPAGLKAIDHLRLQAGLPLFTHEFAPRISAVEAGFSAIRPSSPDDPNELVRVRAFAKRQQGIQACATLPATQRPARGEIAVTSATDWDSDGTCLVMGYVHREDRQSARLADPLGGFQDLSLVLRSGLLS